MSVPWAAKNVPGRILTVLQYAYPLAVLVFFAVFFTVRSIRNTNKSRAAPDESDSVTGPGGKPLPPKHAPRNASKEPLLDFSKPRKALFHWLTVLIGCTFIANAAENIFRALLERKGSDGQGGWWCGESAVVYIVGGFFVYCLLLISMFDSQPSPTDDHVATWIAALVLEVALFATSIVYYTNIHPENYLGDNWKDTIRPDISQWELLEVVVDGLRIALLASSVAFYLLFKIFLVRAQAKAAQAATSQDETTGLLSDECAANGDANGHANGYGATAGGGRHKHTEGAPPGWERPMHIPTRSWWEYIRGYSLFFPYLWPAKDPKLQAVVIVCLGIVVLQRLVNIAVPTQVGVIVDILSGEDGPVRMPWGAICLYIFFRLLQGSNGFLGAMRGWLWIPIGQYSYRELSVAAFEHVHGLSLDFHLGKKTGEVISALGKGSSINTFLEQITFQVLPMLVDLAVAICYFLIKFDVYYALIVTIVTFWYIYITIRMAQWRAEIRREMVNSDRESDAIKQDSIQSYETVKYFNAEAFEFNRYREAVRKFQGAESLVLVTLNVMNFAQNMCFMLGLMIACFLAAYQVTYGQQQVGKFVTMLFYMAQLQSPLNFFGTFYRVIQSALINSERMLELFKEKPTLVDSDTAQTVTECQGEVDFSDVHFSYDPRKAALTGLDFHCAPGTTTALVGESGGGKSTVFRLLYRFYSADSGSIRVDGRDLTDITIDSLRSHIGVVPQDTVLFNETVMYNLRYANRNATDEEVYNACRAASIHDKILAFPDEYNTKVGERGLRLSGGEKQRIAIARTILKNPKIIMLDEATAALDTETEQHIQEALVTLGANRTMLVIAHRLSTITQADQILVLHEGKVDERGTHEELLNKKGRYASMWKKQVRAQQAAKEAQALHDHAERLRREIGDGNGSASQSEDERENLEARERQYERSQAQSSSGRGHGHNLPPGHP